MTRILKVPLRHERDALAVRRAARDIARLLGFEHQDQIRITTAVSELVRSAISERAPDAEAEFLVEDELPQRLLIRVRSANLNGSHASPVNSGTIAARRLLESIEESADSNEITLFRTRPKDAPAITSEMAQAIRNKVESIDAAETGGYLDELKQQNRELSSTLLELERKQQELTRLNAELADTNRGVMALYAELDERANHLRQADELKTKFLSNMSHEFRTPLNSIVALSKLLLEQVDGTLNAEQTRQVQLIRDSSSELFEWVSDLLDLAKVEAGKSSVSIARFSVADLFGALRGMVRPLLRSSRVSLEFEPAEELAPLFGDEAKVAQVLRNFLSNAVKFTETGSIKVTAQVLHKGDHLIGRPQAVQQESVLFCVSDSGIGISQADQDMIFEEFTQVRHSLQHRVRGTGLGLPLCRKLADLVGGQVWVESELGLGSKFYFIVPRFFRPVIDASGAFRSATSSSSGRPVDRERARLPLLVVSNSEERRADIESRFGGSAFVPVAAGASTLTSDFISQVRPHAAIVDVSSVDTETAIRATKLIGKARVPFVQYRDDEWLQGAGPGIQADPIDFAYLAVLRSSLGKVLLLDDDEKFRAILGKAIEPYCGRVVATGDSDLALAGAQEADFIVIDLMMPGMDGLTFLALLRERAATEGLPALICSSRTLSREESILMQELRAVFLSKSDLEPVSIARAMLEACLLTGSVSTTSLEPA